MPHTYELCEVSGWCQGVAPLCRFCKLDEAGDNLVRAAMSRLNLSARGITACSNWREPYENLVGQAIVDLAGSENIQSVHLAEALHTVPVSFGSTGRS